MIKSLHILFKRAIAVPFKSTIHTDSTLLISSRRRKGPHALLDEPGVKIRRGTLQVDSGYPDEIMDEHELDDDPDFMKVDKVFDEGYREQKRSKLKIAAKFFTPRPQPSMLTWNERQCIQYLHKQDPVQWNVKTLSESFPATPDIIKKILRSKRKIVPELAKKLDERVQRNWELLSEGKLKGDPAVLKHLKKFINKREVLLEQIKNEAFYLPEIKQEPKWNQGQMHSIISEYEKMVERLVEEQSPKTLPGLKEGKDMNEEDENSLDLVHAQIKAESENVPKTKDSFKFGQVINTYKQPLTLVELESKILEKAENRKELDLTEKVILHNKLGARKENHEKLIKSSNPVVMEDDTNRSLRKKRKVPKNFDKVANFKNNNMKFEGMRPEEFSTMQDFTQPDENTLFVYDKDAGKILNQLQNNLQTEEKSSEKKEKKTVDFSDSERLKREHAYYDKEVLHIKDTAFWNNNRSNDEKVAAELNKSNLDEFLSAENTNVTQKIFVLHPDPYPERIKIPENKKGSGLTFRVKDCYYDDDGEFLYRVPGMMK